MFSFKLVILCALVVITLAEPPRRKSKFRSFARQEETDNGQSEDSGPYPPAGWKPEGERLVLPLRHKPIRQQEEPEFQGYNYPKPTDTYGPPDENETTEPTETEETTTDSTDETTTDENSTDETTTDNPQSQNFRKQSEKLKKLLKNQKAQLQSFQHLQPFFYVNPGQLSQPQLVYILQ